MKHLDVVAAIIIYHDLILCMQRGKSQYEYVSYKYEFPGGKIEPGETIPEALMQELNEEMNIWIEVSDEDYFMTVNHVYPDFELCMHCYICYVDSQEFVRKEHIDHQWVSPKDLYLLDWAAADIAIVDKLQACTWQGGGKN